MAMQPMRRSSGATLLLIVAAIICFVIDAFFEFARISVQLNVIYGLLFLGLALFAGAFL